MLLALLVVQSAVTSSRQDTLCLTDDDLAQVAANGKQSLEAARYSVTVGGKPGPFDFSFAPANYTFSGVNPSSRYIVPRLGPWREGDFGGDSFLNWGIGELDTLTSRQAVVVVMCTPPASHMWSLEAAVLYRLQLGANPRPGASISNTENSATLSAAKENSPLIVIMSPDRNTVSAVQKAFNPVKPKFTVATIVINGTAELLKFGTRPLQEGCDMFQLCMRVHASPVQMASSAFQAYFNRKFPLFLVEPSFPGEDVPFYPIPDRPMREGPTTEVGLDVRRSVLSLAVIKRLQAAGLTLRQNVSFHAVELDKRRCLIDSHYHPYGSGNCYGTSSDGRYTLSDNYSLPSGNMDSLVIVVVGANHVATGNAADNQLLHDTHVAVNPENMADSANFYLRSAAVPEDAGLFAFAFAQNCSLSLFGSFCAKVTPQKGGSAGALLRLEAYLDNISGTRPSKDLLHPIALVFTRA